MHYRLQTTDYIPFGLRMTGQLKRTDWDFSAVFYYERLRWYIKQQSLFQSRYGFFWALVLNNSANSWNNGEGAQHDWYTCPIRCVLSAYFQILKNSLGSRIWPSIRKKMTIVLAFMLTLLEFFCCPWLARHDEKAFKPSRTDSYRIFGTGQIFCCDISERDAK